MKNKKGQSMFELLVAVFVVALALTAIVSLVTSSIANTTFSKDRTLAAKHTQDAVEWLRQERDTNWAAFASRASASGLNYCMDNLDGWDPGPCSGSQVITNTSMKRQVTLILASSDTVEARVVTSWSDSTGVHESRVTTYFTNWRTK